MGRTWSRVDGCVGRARRGTHTPPVDREGGSTTGSFGWFGLHQNSRRVCGAEDGAEALSPADGRPSSSDRPNRRCQRGGGGGHRLVLVEIPCRSNCVCW